MTKQTPWTRLVFAALLAAGPAAAQESPRAADLQVAQLLPMKGGFAEPGGERIVKGAPYCADAVHETVQWLPDAEGGAPNRIVHQQTTRLCRDGAGRTRQEVERHGRKLVYLHDTVAGENWLLDPVAKTARQLGGGARFGESFFDSAAWRGYADRMREWGREFGKRFAAEGTPPTPPTPPEPPMPPMPALLGSHDHEVEIIRMGGPDVPQPPLSDLAPPAVGLRAMELAPRGPGSVTSLGSKEIEGVQANGERTSWTIAAGKVDNEKPITIVREVWTSPELMLTLRSRDFDPRAPEVDYRLSKLKRGEPDPALMKVPADYAVRRPGAKASSATR